MYPCPCCGYLVFDEPAGSDDICEICFWHDDLSQLRFPRMTGANHVSLLDAQRKYREIGACEERVLAFARRPTAADARDESWRPLDPGRDYIEEPVSGVDYGESYPDDSTEFYYWRTSRQPKA